MIVLQIEHPVPDFNEWKMAFDNDPLSRKQAGVRRYRIFRLHSDPGYVIVELEFDRIEDAEQMHEALKKLWNQVSGKIMSGPQSRIFETIESVTLT
ncbi:MAG TPA: hypothetical protein PKV73_13590 [Agriterribacter sp.]|nr:hypothetical protein [Agriterribacter sp.]